ncbi:TIGR02206 family membrane protein [Akkermansiaceae bacterium]|nr:TIGR02206 family membrane protein [Akkermansiaceae bacterium]
MFTEVAFHAYSLSHGIAVGVVLCLGLLSFFLSSEKTPRMREFIRYTLITLLLFSTVSGILSVILRYGFSSEAWQVILHYELPFYLCDIVSFVLVAALWFKNQRAAEVGYVWGIAGTAQGLVTPVLNYEFPSLEFLFFFIQHGVVPISAMIVILRYKLIPLEGAYLRVWFWTFVYFAITLFINWLLGVNYGFLNSKPPSATALDYLGVYPWYLVSLHLVAAVVFAVLLMPFRKNA